jgi:hypothetical protein
MKILFAGPSLSGTPYVPLEGGKDRLVPEHDLTCRGPARCGDITRAVEQGFRRIGLVDGRFEDVAAVWHKEILYALSRGVVVYGAASMGALRAAECHPFGMIGLGQVFERYAFGGLEDDAAVAQIHAPAEFGYVAFSEAMVTVDATLERAMEAGSITLDEAGAIRDACNAVFFKDRTRKRIFACADAVVPGSAARLAAAWRHIKREDAEILLQILLGRELKAPSPQVSSAFSGWTFNETVQWAKLKN